MREIGIVSRTFDLYLFHRSFPEQFVISLDAATPRRWRTAHVISHSHKGPADVIQHAPFLVPNCLNQVCTTALIVRNQFQGKKGKKGKNKNYVSKYCTCGRLVLAASDVDIAVFVPTVKE